MMSDTTFLELQTTTFFEALFYILKQNDKVQATLIFVTRKIQKCRLPKRQSSVIFSAKN